jgi:putative redox protein
MQYKIEYLSDLKTRCTHSSGETIDTDAPKDNQGEGRLFSPTDLIAVGLGSCILTVMAIAARSLGVDLKGTTVEVQKEMSKNAPRRIERIAICVSCPNRFSLQIQKKLEKAAMDCPVHHSLHPDMQQIIEFTWGG